MHFLKHFHDAPKIQLDVVQSHENTSNTSITSQENIFETLKHPKRDLNARSSLEGNLVKTRKKKLWENFRFSQDWA